jgi:glycosyltransferase involved in cell wall biosynthesis
VRILYLADIRFPLERANGIQTFETCRALSARGHDVTLFVRPDTARPPRDPWAFYGGSRSAAPRLDIVTTWALPGPARRGGYLAAAWGRLVTSGADVAFTRDLGVAAMALRLPRRMRPAVVYEAHGYAPTVSAELPRLLGTVAPPSATKLRRLTNRETRVWCGAEGYVTLTKAHRAELTERFGPRDNAEVVADGTRLQAPRVFTPAPNAIPHVGYAGHLYPWKGVDVLIEALALLPGVHGLIVGGQPGERDRSRLEALARARGIADRVTFTGWLPPADVAAAIGRCQALALPNVRSTISERYTSPLKLFDYLGAGRAIVASDLPALREVLSDGVNAILVEPGQPRPLAAAFERVFSDRALLDRLCRAAFDAAESYSWEARAARLEPVLQAAEAAR